LNLCLTKEKYNENFENSLGQVLLFIKGVIERVLFTPKTGDVSIIAIEQANKVVKLMIFTLFLSISLTDY